MIYLDNAATTQKKPQQVIDAVVEAMTTMGNAARGAHAGALAASRAVYDARCKLAELFGCARPDHVVFTCNSTEALNIAINGTLGAEKENGARVITTELEHNSVLRPLYRLAGFGKIELDFVKADRHGCVDYDGFERLTGEKTRAIVCTHGSNLTGTVLDLKRIGAIAKKHGLLFIVDASQTAGVFPIDMEEMGIDILCFTGHKGLMGPQGTGGLAVREGVEIRPWKVGGSGVHSYSREQPVEYPTRLEAGTLNSHGIIGLSAALDFIESVGGVEAVHKRESSLANRFYEGVSKIGNVSVYGDFLDIEARTAIVTLNIGDLDSAAVSDILSQEYDIATRAGAHCAPLAHKALGTVEQGAVRFSFSWFNTEEEIDEAVRAVAELALEASKEESV